MGKQAPVVDSGPKSFTGGSVNDVRAPKTQPPQSTGVHGKPDRKGANK